LQAWFQSKDDHTIQALLVPIPWVCEFTCHLSNTIFFLQIHICYKHQQLVYVNTLPYTLDVQVESPDSLHVLIGPWHMTGKEHPTSHTLDVVNSSGKGASNQDFLCKLYPGLNNKALNILTFTLHHLLLVRNNP